MEEIIVSLVTLWLLGLAASVVSSRTFGWKEYGPGWYFWGQVRFLVWFLDLALNFTLWLAEMVGNMVESAAERFPEAVGVITALLLYAAARYYGSFFFGAQ